MYSTAYVWAKILGHMEQKLTAPVVSTFLDDAEVLELTDNKLVLYSPTSFRKETILQRYSDYIKEAMREHFDTEIELSVICEEELEDFKMSQKKLDFIDFNPQFTFSHFVVGSSNRFAHAAARAVAEKPAEAYNPLYIHGPSGLGKTHLLYAIATEIHKIHPEYNIVYIKGDQFTNELIEAVREGKNVEFRSKYRNADLFLIDDIQFIAGKAATEEEFFHTFNTLYENHKQIVLTADRPPHEMVRLEDRLRTRFEWGLLADIQPPDYETRMAIIKNKAESLSLKIPDDVCEYIAENITSNVRQIEGTVKKLKAYCDIDNLILDVPHVSRTIKDMFKGKAEALPTTGLIISEVCRFYSLAEDVLRGGQRNRNTAEARQVAMYMLRKMLNLSFPEIGREFDRDHTTAMHSIGKVEKLLADPRSGLQDNLRDITSNINNRL